MEFRPAVYTTLTLAEKRTLCEKAKADSSLSHSQLASWATKHSHTPLDVKRSTVEGILKRSAEYAALPDAQHYRKRLCRPSLRSSDDKIMQKVDGYKAWHGNATIAGNTVLKIARREGVQLPSGNLPSRAWLYRFQQRTGLWFVLRHGEGASLDKEQVEEGAKALRKAVAGYHPSDVFNMDETAFFYRREPRGTLTVGKKEKGKKQSKQRITVCVATNADGTDQLPLHFIGTSKVPRPLKDRNLYAEVGATYTNTPKAWMNTAKYCEWLTEQNERMRREQRNILLLVDNVSSHNDDAVELTNVVIHKLPPNTTAALQPMDQGIIKSLKDQYQNRKQDAELDMFYQGLPYAAADIYTAMKWAGGSLNCTVERALAILFPNRHDLEPVFEQAIIGIPDYLLLGMEQGLRNYLDREGVRLRWHARENEPLPGDANAYTEQNELVCTDETGDRLFGLYQNYAAQLDIGRQAAVCEVEREIRFRRRDIRARCATLVRTTRESLRALVHNYSKAFGV